MADTMDADTTYDQLTEFAKKVDELKESLMDREMLLVDQIEVCYLLRIEYLIMPTCNILRCFLPK